MSSIPTSLRPARLSKRLVLSPQKLKRNQLRWPIWIYLVLMSAFVTATGLMAVLKHVRELNEQFEDAQHAIQIQERATLYSMLHRVDDLKIDPRPALLESKNARRLADRTKFPAKQLDHLLSSLPSPRTIPDGSTINVRHVSKQAPATMVELAIADKSGRFIDGLSRIDIEVLNGDRRLRQVQIAKGSRPTRNLAIALLLDCSISMQGEPLQTAKIVAQKFARDVAGPARVRPWQFSDSPIALTPWTFDPDVVCDAIKPLAPQAGTALYASIQEAILSLSQRPEHRSLVVLTDGEDSFNKILPEALVELCHRHQVTLHAIVLGNPKNGFDKLQMVASQSGGSFRSAAIASDLSSAFEQLRATLEEPIYRIAILDDIDPHQPLTILMGEHAAAMVQ